MPIYVPGTIMGSLIAGSTTTLATPDTTTAYGSQFTTIDRGNSVPNGSIVWAIGLYLVTARSDVRVKVALENSSTAFDIVVSEPATAHAGAGWRDFVLATPYEIPASGTYRLGAAWTAGTDSWVSVGSYAYKTVDAPLGPQTGFTAATNGAIGLRWTSAVDG